MGKKEELNYIKGVIKYGIEEVEGFCSKETFFNRELFFKASYSTSKFLSQMYVITILKEEGKLDNDSINSLNLEEEARKIVGDYRYGIDLSNIEKMLEHGLGSYLIQLYTTKGVSMMEVINKKEEDKVYQENGVGDYTTESLEILYDVFGDKLEQLLTGIQDRVEESNDYGLSEIKGIIQGVIEGNEECVNDSVLKYFKTLIMEDSEYIFNIKESFSKLKEEEVTNFLYGVYTKLGKEIYLSGTILGEANVLEEITTMEGVELSTSKEVDGYILNNLKSVYLADGGILEEVFKRVCKKLDLGNINKKEEEYTKLLAKLTERNKVIEEGLVNSYKAKIFDRYKKDLGNIYYGVKRLLYNIGEEGRFVLRDGLLEYYNQPIKLRNGYVTYFYNVIGVEGGEIKVMESFIKLPEEEHYKLLVVEDKELEWDSLREWYERLLIISTKEEQMSKIRQHEEYLEGREKEYKKAKEYYKEYVKIKEESQLLLADSKITKRLSNQMEIEGKKLLELEEEFKEIKGKYIEEIGTK